MANDRLKIRGCRDPKHIGRVVELGVRGPRHSKAVSWCLTALPSSPQYVPLDGIVGLSKLGSELVVHLRPILPLKEGRPSPTKAA